MDLIVMILAAMSGALIGSSTGIFLMYRKLRPVNAAELDALRTKLRNAEFDLNTAVANVAKLKKEATEQTSKINEGVVEKQKQLEAALAPKNLETEHRNAAEQRIAELIGEADARKAHEAEIEAKAKALEAKAAELDARGGEASSKDSEEQERQLAALQAQVKAGGSQIQELMEQVVRLTSEAADAKQHADEAEKTRVAAETELKQRAEDVEKARATAEAELKQRAEEAEKTRAAAEAELKQRVEEADKARAEAEAELKRRAEEAEKIRAEITAELNNERERLHVLTEQVSMLQSDLSAQDVRMQEERENAARGMELLRLAQQNLSRVIQAATEAPPAGNGRGHAAVGETPASNGNGHGEPAPADAKELETVAGD